MNQNATVMIATGDRFDVRAFTVEEVVSSYFRVSLGVLSAEDDVDLDGLVGGGATFRLTTSTGERSWTGVVADAEQDHAEPNGLSSYRLSIVPALWMAAHGVDFRIYQQMSELEIALEVLGRWGIAPELRLDAGRYKKRKYRVQYAESDLDFLNRMLEDAGIAYVFEGGRDLVLADALEAATPRSPIVYRADGLFTGTAEIATQVAVTQRVRPGRYTIFDHDARRSPGEQPQGTAAAGLLAETELELFHYIPGATLFAAQGDGSTPVADDRGAARSDDGEAAMLAIDRLAAQRAAGKRCTFTSNAFDLAAGTVLSFIDHPRADLGPGRPWLLERVVISGMQNDTWTVFGDAVSAEAPYCPPLKTPKPKVDGTESATVVGPEDGEIHTDEFGRVRLHFHWDRHGARDETSSCWIPVNQPWAGTGYGGSNLPRVGQEVVVDFLNGDPDRPIVVGRVYTELQKTPFSLPASKTRSGLRSSSTGGSGGHHEIMFEDAAGKELLFTQSQRDESLLVKNDKTVEVKSDRTAAIGGSDSETVGGNQWLDVAFNRTVTVVGQEDRTIEGPMGMKITVSNGKAKITSAVSMTFRCGASTIYVTPSYVMVQAPKTLLAHGDEETKAAMGEGHPLPELQEDLEEKELARKRQEDAKKTEALKALMASGNQAFLDDYGRSVLP